MENTRLRRLLLTAIFAALTAVGAYVRIGSVTLQVFFACVSGMLLGPLWGTASQGLYVALGLLGLPVFTQGGGPMYVMQPTFGFLLGLLPLAAVTGWLSRYYKIPLFVSAVGGLCAMYAVALPYFYFITGQLLGLEALFMTACAPYLPFDGLKLLSACLLGQRLRLLLRNDLIF